jgi:peptidoglycan/LPS O-acetylase OafA/YrhL
VTPKPSAENVAASVDTGDRDVFIDFVRAFSLLVVVAWHWVFTILLWEKDGPHASNPIGMTHGLFLVTWLLQVMPLFFFIGGHAHTVAWNRASTKGPTATLWSFAWKRLRTLLAPAFLLLGVWVALGIAVTAIYDIKWMGRAVKLVVSPLWFLAVYGILVALFPLSYRLHKQFGALVLVWAVGLAGVVDVLRFSKGFGYEWVGWFNMILVWGVCHQLGFFYADLRDKPRRWSLMFLWTGLFALFGLVASGLYPGSMVGVPGERFSNMAPPTLCIVALVTFQAGVAMAIRPWVLERLQTRQRWKTVNEVVNRFSMPLFLFHSTGMALSRSVGYLILKRIGSRQPNAGWWLTRPVAWVGPLLWTLPVIWLFGRTPMGRKSRTKRTAPTS